MRTDTAILGLTLGLILVGCGADGARPEFEGEAAPDPAPPAETTPTPAVLVLPDDGRCVEQRQAHPDPSALGDPAGDIIVEHLDGDGCVAVRYLTTVVGRTTRVEVQVPGDPGWFPQPPAYVDLTPRPLISTQTVDAEGRMIEATEDLGADGTVDTREARRFVDGRLVEQITDSQTVEGPRRRVQRWAFDAQGNEVRLEDHYGGEARVIERELDGRGHVVDERTSLNGEVRTRRTRVYDGDTLLEERYESGGRVETTEMTYRADGTLARREWRRADGGHTFIRERHDFSPNEAGEVVEHYQRDDGADGRIEAQRWTTLDAEGRQRLVVHDRDGNGAPDWTREQRWDAQGRLVWWRNTDQGETALLRTWTFDGEDMAEHTSWPAPGERPGTWIERRWLDGDFVVIDTLLDDGNEVLMGQTRTRYSADDVLLERTVDRDGDGVVDEQTWQVLDAEQRVVRVDTERDGVRAWRTFAFDHTGELTQERASVTGAPDGEGELVREVVRDLAGNEIYTFTRQARSAPPRPGEGLVASLEVGFRAVTDYLSAQ